MRNGSRGLLWLEPLLEVATPAGRVAFGPVQAGDVAGLVDAGLLDDVDRAVGLSDALAAHPLHLGLTEQLPYFAKQRRITFARVGLTDPLSLDDYAAHGGWAGLDKALAMAPTAVVGEVLESGLRGRGGAAFPAGIKWKTVAAAPAPRKAVVCNADEGDSGTFSDRMLMEGDPYTLVEGMAIAGRRGRRHLRRDLHPLRIPARRGRAARGDRARDRRRPHRRVAARHGPGVPAGRAPRRRLVRLRRGDGAAREHRGPARRRARQAAAAGASHGLFGWPTVINNVITLASVPRILADGAQAYHAFGAGRSRGTLPFQLAGNIRHGGLVEAPFGVTLRELLFDFGGGIALRPARSRRCRWAARWAPTCRSRNGTCRSTTRPTPRSAPPSGHGGIVVHDDTANLAGLARYAFEFCALESCGKCTPCRIGSTRGVEVVERSGRGAGLTEGRAGGTAARPVRHDGLRQPVRDGRHDPVPGVVCAGSLP